MKNIYVSITPHMLKEEELNVRRVLHHRERRHLSLEAQSMAYCLLNSQSVPSSVAENTIQQAVTLGSISGAVVDAQTFEALFHVVLLDPSFELPFVLYSPLTLSNSWVC